MAGRFNDQKAKPKQFLAWLALFLIVVWLGANRPRGETVAVNSSEPSKSRDSSAAPPAATAPKAGNKAEVVTDILNLRSEPNTNAGTVIGNVPKGTVVEVLEEQGSWLKVRLNDGKVGFVAYGPKLIKLANQ